MAISIKFTTRSGTHMERDVILADLSTTINRLQQQKSTIYSITCVVDIPTAQLTVLQTIARRFRVNTILDASEV